MPRKIKFKINVRKRRLAPKHPSGSIDSTNPVVDPSASHPDTETVVYEFDTDESKNFIRSKIKAIT